MLVDSHCHLDRLDLSLYSGGLSEVLKNAAANDIGHLLCVCVVLDQFPAMLNLVKDYDHVSVSAGLHPDEMEVNEPSVEELIALGSEPKCVGIGETGLDYYRDTEHQERQKERFRNHIRAAKTLQKPLIIHTRAASLDTIAIMQSENASEAGGVLHCFTESWEMAKQALDLGFYISFSGIITFKNAEDLREVVKKVPIDRILIETDAPYLAPVPYRGKQNQPAYVKYTAEAVAALKKMDYAQIAEQTTDNFFSLFKASKLNL